MSYLYFPQLRIWKITLYVMIKIMLLKQENKVMKGLKRTYESRFDSALFVVEIRNEKDLKKGK